MRVIGIDPGSHKAGWGIVDVNKDTGTASHLSHGVWRLNNKLSFANRLVLLVKSAQETVQKYSPDYSALEEVFFAKNAHSALVLGQARGAIFASLSIMKVPVGHVSATFVKSHITGNGRASKDQVSKMISAILKLDDIPNEDAADALAIAVSYGHRIVNPNCNNFITKKVSARKKRAGLLKLAKMQGKISEF